MGCKCDLTASENSVITSELVKAKLTLEISKMIVKKIVAAPTK